MGGIMAGRPSASRRRRASLLLTVGGAAGWSTGGGLARSSRACALAPPSACVARMAAEQEGPLRFVWGADVRVGPEAARPFEGLGVLSASYGWCLLDSELQEMQKYQDALKKVTSSFLAPEDVHRLCLAVEVAYQSRAWAAQQRSDARLQHAVSCALVLAELQMEAEPIIAALLVGICEDTGLSTERIDKLLGPTVSGAVQDVTNVWRLSSLLANSPYGDAEQLEDRCKILLAGCDDWRGVVVSLASRLVSIRAMQHPTADGQASDAGTSDEASRPQQTEEERERARLFALQTLQVFVPLAHRLGMWYFKTELEQRCFALTLPKEYQHVSLQLDKVQKLHAPALQETAVSLRQALRQDPVLSRHVDWIRVQARTKAAYSAYTKMQRKGQTLDELHDVLAIRVIFRPTVSQRLPAGLHRQRQCMLCYKVLEVAHSLHRPVRGRCVKDYVTHPKPNGYQSLHSTLQLGELHAELQIRTSEMHRFAEHGKASHWLYKSVEDQRPAEDWYELSELRQPDELHYFNREESGFRSSSGHGLRAEETRDSEEHGTWPKWGQSSSPSRVWGQSSSPSRWDGQGQRHGRQSDSEKESSSLTDKVERPVRPQDTPAQGRLRLEAIRRSLREKRVYVTTEDGEVLSLRAGADLQDAVRALENCNTEGGSVVTTARVNGRTVRRGYKIRNGDVLTPLHSSALNSGAWIGQDSTPRDEERGTGPAMPLLPMPWPWSLVGSNDENDLLLWYGEAERKHSQVAVLALANWISLAIAGEVSLASEPLGSLYSSPTAITWALQFGSIALAEAYFLQRRTTYIIRQHQKAQSRSADMLASEVSNGDITAEQRGEMKWPSDVPISVASDPGLGAAVPDEAPIGAILPDAIARFGWMFSDGAPRVGDVRVVLLWVGRLAMLVMAMLALHADSEHGILHDFFQVGSSDVAVVEPSSQLEADLDALTTPPLFSDLILQDVPAI